MMNLNSTLNFDNLKIELSRYGQLLVNRYKAQLKIDGTYSGESSKTLNSLEFISTSNTLEVLADRTLELIDKGIAPGGEKPNINDILEWAKAKKIRPKDGSGKFVAVNNRSMFWMARNIAEAIQEKGTIKRFGYSGTGIIDFVYQNNKEPMMNDIFLAYSRDIQEMIDDITRKKN